MKITKVKLCDEEACYCMGTIECLEEVEQRKCTTCWLLLNYCNCGEEEE